VFELRENNCIRFYLVLAGVSNWTERSEGSSRPIFSLHTAPNKPGFQQLFVVGIIVIQCCFSR